MKSVLRDAPRRFEVNGIPIADYGRIHLDADEMVSVATRSGAELEITRKEWGFYVTPSLNARLVASGLRAVLVVGDLTDRYYILAVESGQEAPFRDYLAKQSMTIVAWLDSAESLGAIEESR